ncbi:keratin-associated protein 5-4-like [Stegodyphus dumicola]|uniref:keratin-associated protein 5-4-like n=1 Tax=Stegodyphus dumicola TaxID=202533 RepID=UPI0015B291F6|nr:keratin-associated protein 5-4-like [Stegodyphus dumicola]
MHLLLYAIFVTCLLVVAEETCPDGKTCPEGTKCCAASSDRYKCCESAVPVMQGSKGKIHEMTVGNKSSPDDVSNAYGVCSPYNCAGTCCDSTSCCEGHTSCCPPHNAKACCHAGASCCYALLDYGCCGMGDFCCKSSTQAGCCPVGSECCKSLSTPGCCQSGYKCCSGGYCCKRSQRCGPIGYCYNGTSAISSLMSFIAFFAMLSLAPWRFLH